jgi:hypothetical protein
MMMFSLFEVVRVVHVALQVSDFVSLKSRFGVLVFWCVFPIYPSIRF